MGWLRRRRERRLRLGGSMPSRYQDLGPGSDPDLDLGVDPASSHDLASREAALAAPAADHEAPPILSEGREADAPDPWPQEPRVYTPIRGVRVFVGMVAAMVLFAAWSTAPVGWVTLAPVYLLLAGAWLESVYARIEVQPTSIRLRSLRGDRTFGRAELGEAVAHQFPRRQHSRTGPGINLSVRLRGERFGMRLTGVLWPRETLHELSRIVRATPFTAPSFRELEANYPGSTRFWNRQMWVPALAILSYIWVSTQYAPLLVG